jgi:diguanylate cyclase (GGDEF)-like protein/PAS domain S-box-containing protein
MSWQSDSSRTQLPTEIIAKVFPFYFAFDQEMQILAFGESLENLSPGLAIGKSVFNYFSLKHPSITFGFETCQQEAGFLFLLEHLPSNLQLKGQMIYDSHQHSLCFLGSPWVADAASLKALGGKLTKNTRTSIPDLLLLLEARGTSLSATRKLADKLTEQRAELQRALRQAELANAVIDQAADAVEITDSEGNISYVNSAFERITGFSRTEVVGKNHATLFCASQPEEKTYRDMRQSVVAGDVWQGTPIGRRKDGSLYYQELTVFPVCNKVEQITNLVSIYRDVSDRERSQDELGSSLSLLQTTFEATADGILVSNTKGHVLNYNQKFIDLWKINESDLTAQLYDQPLGFVLAVLNDPDAFTARIQELYSQPQVESYDVLELKDGRVLEGRSRPQKMGEMVIGRVWSFRDITERQRNEERIRYQASYDLLTALPNRMLFNERLSMALDAAERNDTQLAVMFLDLDRFKLINDTLGHAAGDLLLQGFAQRLGSCLRSSEDILARWAGDEFTLLLPNIDSVEEAVSIAQNILDALRSEFDLDGNWLRVSTSIGIAIYPEHGTDPETLLKHSDAALYRAKESGRNGYHLYNYAMNSDASEQLTMENYLHRALEYGEFVLHYQPLVNVATGEIIQMEALVRWQSPELGLVSPAKFIPLAEETGVIIPLGEWVLRTACAQNRAWQDAGLPNVRIAVNLSAHQFRQARLIEMINHVLIETGLDPEYLELEITETALMKNVERTKTILNELDHMGLSIAMDDFGTGYSSLSYLKAFPFHTLKIDRSFVCDVTVDPNDKAIVAAIVAMAKVLNLNLIAEGVETEMQEYTLRSLGCETMQGFRFSKPVTAEVATELLRKNDLRRSGFSLAAQI